MKYNFKCNQNPQKSLTYLTVRKYLPVKPSTLPYLRTLVATTKMRRLSITKENGKFKRPAFRFWILDFAFEIKKADYISFGGCIYKVIIYKSAWCGRK